MELSGKQTHQTHDNELIRQNNWWSPIFESGADAVCPGSFPPTLEQLKNDPMSHFKFFIQATEKGTNGGKNAQGRGDADAATKAWVKTAFEDVVRCRKACKHIWDTALATFTSAKATTVIAGLPYGAGPALLDQIENQQERQTSNHGYFRAL